MRMVKLEYMMVPLPYSVKVNGKLKRMSGFDEEHIPNNCGHVKQQ